MDSEIYPAEIYPAKKDLIWIDMLIHRDMIIEQFLSYEVEDMRKFEEMIGLEYFPVEYMGKTKENMYKHCFRIINSEKFFLAKIKYGL
jgi:hypothetical protein